jgi:Ca-activated chloride channel homolog
MVTFGLPALLLLLLIVPLAGAMLWWSAKQRRQALLAYAGNRLLWLRSNWTNPRLRRLKAGLMLCTLLLLALAAALPEHGQRKLVLPRAGSDVVIAVDVSRSMGVQDVAPSRLDAAKHAADALVDHLNGDRVAVVVFAGSAVDRFPLTTDLDAAKQVIDSLAILDSGVKGGTDLSSAFQTADTVLKGDATRGRVVVVISDGEDLAGNDLQAARQAAGDSLVIDTIGVGTTAGGPVYALNPLTGQSTAVIDPSTGTTAISHRDDGNLHQLAASGGGTAYDGNTTDFAFDLSGAIDRLQPTRFESDEATIPNEYFQIPLTLALLLLLIDVVATEGRLARTRPGQSSSGDPASLDELTRRSA